MVRSLKEVEKETVLAAIVELDFNLPKAAKRLGISIRTLYRKLKEWSVEAPVGGNPGAVLFSEYKKRCEAIVEALEHARS
jgi:transposase